MFTTAFRKYIENANFTGLMTETKELTVNKTALEKKILPILNRFGFVTLLGILLLLFAMQLVNGEHNVFKIYDNLDSEITSRILPLRNGNLFSFSNEEVIPQMANGLKRNSLNASSRNFESLLFYWFPPVYAYLINYALINLIAFIGMFLLLCNYLLKELENRRIIAALLAFTFTLLPSYTIYGMAILGAPMLTWCILNFVNGKRKLWSLLFIIFYPFYSSLVLGGHVYVGLLFVTGVWFYFKSDRKIAVKLMGIAVLIGALYVISEINLFNQYLFDRSFVSHRTDWDPTFDQIDQTAETLDFYSALRRAWDLTLRGEINAKVYPIFILGFLAYMLIFNFRSVIRDRFIVGLIVLMTVITLLYGFYFADLKPWIYLKNQFMLLKTFRIDRIFFFLPVFWYILFALLIRNAILSGKKLLMIGAVVFLLINFFYVPLKNRELMANVSTFVKGKPKSMITWKKFFAEDLFAEVKKDIGLPQDKYKTVSIGITPAVSLYNGFYTLDLYSNNYPLSHKRSFRKIIAPELEKSPRWKASFDKWGGECFIFSSEIEYRPVFIPSEKSLKNLELNTRQLFLMGGRYILSALEIENAEDLNLGFLKKYTDPNTPLVLWLYEVRPPRKS